MSLGIAFKGPEGIVLAADSRVTLNAQIQNMTIPATFDNATKLLRFSSAPRMGAVTYGLGALGQGEPRTAHSFLPELDESLKEVSDPTVKDFSDHLSSFFSNQWDRLMPEEYSGQDMIFLVAGYDSGASYGTVYQFRIPSALDPVEQNPGMFGATWGGQIEYVNRILHGFDPRLPGLVSDFIKSRSEDGGSLSPEEQRGLIAHLKANLSIPIPYQFLPLQDCVDFSIFLIKATATLQSFYVGVRGVGGAIDVATITRVNGFEAVQQKSITGETGGPNVRGRT